LVADPVADPGVTGHRVVGHTEHEEHEGHRERHDRSGEGDERRQRHQAERGDHHGPLAAAVEMIADRQRRHAGELARAEDRGQLGGGGTERDLQRRQERRYPSQRGVRHGLRAGDGGERRALDADVGARR